MKKLFCFFVIVAAALCGWEARAEVVTGVAVVVGNAVITEGEIRADVVALASAVQNTYPNDPARRRQELEKIKDNSIEQRVEDKLILHDFISSGYLTNVVEAFIDDLIRHDIKEVYGGDYSKFIKTQLAKGVTYEMYRRMRRENFIIYQMKRQNVSDLHKIIISPLKIEHYYQGHKDEFKMEDQIKLRMIVIPQTAEDAPGMAKRIAEEILAKINSGVSFDEMARVNSAGSQRVEGGDYGWHDRAYFQAALTQAAFSLKPGQVSGVIDQTNACYLLQVDDARAAHIKDLKEVRHDIEHTLTLEENRRLHDLWIQRLKNKSYVSFESY
jgi:peptidyl-prolyl cis-trans isomerase SurA